MAVPRPMHSQPPPGSPPSPPTQPFQAAPPLQGSVPPLSVSMGPAYGPPPVPPRKGAPKWALFAGIGAAGLVVLAGAGGLAYKLLATKHKALPVAAAKLPPDTVFLSDTRLDGYNEDPGLRETFLASDLAGLVCGGEGDFVDRLLGLPVLGPTSATALLKPEALAERKGSLVCGQALAKSLQHPSVSGFVVREDDRTSHSLVVAHLSVTELPASFGFEKREFSGLPGACFLGDPNAPSAQASKGGSGAKVEPKPRECTEKSYAAFHDGDLWVFGRRPGVELAARAYGKPRSDLSTSVENLELAADTAEGLPVRRTEANPKSAAAVVRLPCAMAAYGSVGGTKVMEACFPPAVERSIAHLDGKVRAVTYEIDGPLEVSDGIHMNLIFVARDNGAGKEVEGDLTEAVKEWKSSIENNESKLVKLVKESPRTIEQKKWAVAMDAFLRAMDHMTVVRSGRAVTIRVNEKFTEAEKRDLDDVVAKSAADKAAAVAIANAVAAGTPIRQTDLAELVGAPWAEYLLATKATEADCTDLKAKLTALEKANARAAATAIPAGVKSRIKWQCEGTLVSDTARTCFLNAHDAAAFGKCTLPEQPKASAYGEVAQK